MSALDSLAAARQETVQVCKVSIVRNPLAVLFFFSLNIGLMFSPSHNACPGVREVLRGGSLRLSAWGVCFVLLCTTARRLFERPCPRRCQLPRAECPRWRRRWHLLDGKRWVSASVIVTPFLFTCRPSRPLLFCLFRRLFGRPLPRRCQQLRAVCRRWRSRWHLHDRKWFAEPA